MRMFHILALIAGLSMAQSGIAAADSNNIDTGSTELIVIADGIYAIAPKFAGANGALIVRANGNIVVDSHGSPASARALINAMEKVSDQPVRYVINTHWHVDHHSGNRAYRETFGHDVIFISHEQTRRDIPTLGAGQFEQAAPYRASPAKDATEVLQQDAENHDALSPEQISAITAFRDEQTKFAAAENFDYELADITFSDSLTLHGDETVEVFFLHPAHTASDAIVYVRSEQVLIVGDVLTKPILWTWSSYPTTYVSTLRQLESLPIQKIVIGHGGPVLDGKQYLTLVREFMELIVSFATDAAASGQTSEGAIAAAADDQAIEKFRRQFVEPDADRMFDQMVGWTIDRALQELQSAKE